MGLVGTFFSSILFFLFNLETGVLFAGLSASPESCLLRTLLFVSLFCEAVLVYFLVFLHIHFCLSFYLSFCHFCLIHFNRLTVVMTTCHCVMCVSVMSARFLYRPHPTDGYTTIKLNII